MIKSMTGFGRAKTQISTKELLVEIKTVNNRYTDINIKMPRTLSFAEEKIRDIINKNVSRGKVDVYINFSDVSENTKNITVDMPLAKAYIDAFSSIKDMYDIKDDISVSLISKFPDVFKINDVVLSDDQVLELLIPVLDEAIIGVIRMRESEGVNLKLNLFDKLKLLENLLNQIKDRAPHVVSDYRKRLEMRINEMLAQRIIDENRISIEVALFSDRCSIDEEIIRLGSHIKQFKETLEISEPVGRKLDFLVQEMNREINTIGSKANDLSISKNVLELKSELEKIREQVQNIE